MGSGLGIKPGVVMFLFTSTPDHQIAVPHKIAMGEGLEGGKKSGKKRENKKWISRK